MSNDQIRLNAIDRSDDQMMEIDLMPSDGRLAHYAIASVVVRMDGQASDSPDLVSFAERLVSRYNACAGMADPAAEIAELKRQRDELLAVLNKYEEAFDGLFGHCGSNGVFNHWGRRIDCTTLNEAHELSSNATKGPAS